MVYVLAQIAPYPGSAGIPACRSKPIQIESVPPTQCKQGCLRSLESIRLRARDHVFAAFHPNLSARQDETGTWLAQCEVDA